jgi:hypothetical protein
MCRWYSTCRGRASRWGAFDREVYAGHMVVVRDRELRTLSGAADEKGLTSEGDRVFCPAIGPSLTSRIATIPVDLSLVWLCHAGDQRYSPTSFGSIFEDQYL